MNLQNLKTRKVLFLYSPLIIGFSYCYYRVIGLLAERWISDDMYSYGFLIPLISLYLVWISREEVRRVKSKPLYFPGYLVCIGGLIILIFGQAGNIAVFEELSMIITLTGLVLLSGGAPLLRKTWFPISYLIFMIPIWEVITDRLHPYFQRFSADMGVKLMHLVGIPVHQSGLYLELPNMTLKVAKVCSGVNYLISIIAIGIPLSYLYLRSWFKRILLIFSAVVVAIIFNGIRVAMVGFFAFHTGQVHGPGDLFRTLIISAIGFFVIFAGIWFFGEGWREDEESPAPGRGALPQGKKSSHVMEQVIFLLPAFLILLLAGTYINTYRPSSAKLRNTLEEIPLVVGRWKGKDIPPLNVLRPIHFDDSLSREYQDGEDRAFRVFIGYYDVQSQGQELLDYRTAPLFGKGEKIQFSLQNGNRISARYYLEGKREKKSLVVYWFDVNGKKISGKYTLSFQTALSTLFHGRNNGAVIMIKERMDGKEALEEALNRIRLFIQDFYPAVDNRFKTT